MNKKGFKVYRGVFTAAFLIYTVFYISCMMLASWTEKYPVVGVLSMIEVMLAYSYFEQRIRARYQKYCDEKVLQVSDVISLSFLIVAFILWMILLISSNIIPKKTFSYELYWPLIMKWIFVGVLALGLLVRFVLLFAIRYEAEQDS